jgi:hypothetical protein
MSGTSANGADATGGRDARDSGTDELIAALDDAAEARDAATERVAEVGADDLEAVAAAHDRATGLFDRYEDRATGTGDFAAFVEFEDRFATFVAELPEDLPRRGTFETAEERLDERRLSESDFAAAREALAPAADLAARLDERVSAHEAYKNARRAVRERRAELDDRIDELERLRELGAADLDAPVEALEAPIAAYDDAVRDAFADFRREASARELFSLLDAAGAFPLVSLDTPPTEVVEYVETSMAGTEPLPRLLEYAEYSIPKLDHHVEAPSELKRRIATRRTVLERIDAAPLEIGWPPPPADELRWRCRELVSVVGRFAPPDVVAQLRDVRELTREEDYERLRGAARARAALDPGERERLADGRVERDLEAARAERERLEEGLSEYPEP